LIDDFRSAESIRFAQLEWLANGWADLFPCKIFNIIRLHIYKFM